MSRQHLPTERIDFHLPANIKSGPLQPQVEPADPGE
jgi:hypothetical protein